LRRHPIELGVDQQIFFDAQVEVAGHRLRNHSHGIASAVRISADVVTGNDGASGGDGQQRGHHADERALARAIGAKQSEHFLLLYLEGDVVDRREFAEGLNDVVHFNRSGPPILGSIGRTGKVAHHFCARSPADLPASWPGEMSTLAVIPGTNCRRGFSICSFRPMVFMSRLSRLTSRCVAKSPSAALLMTRPGTISPFGSCTCSVSPMPMATALSSGIEARTQVSFRSTMVTIGEPICTTSPWRATRTDTVPEMGASTRV